MANGDVAKDAGFYHPAALGDAFPIHMAVHARGDPRQLAPRLRTLAAAVDPTLRLSELLPLDEVGASRWLEMDFLSRLLVLVSSIALLLSLSAIYAVMSFTVSRRTREIGIRVALGAAPHRICPAVFRRPLAQIGLGIAAGGGLVAALARAAIGGLSTTELALVTAYAALMMGVCLLACIMPTRRALRVEPTVALKADG
jgi:ABC-type antimicrobial peptide transport system permease subunit